MAAADPDLNDEALTKIANPRTIDYAGLERATGVRKDDPRSDIYFLGCIYYHCSPANRRCTETRDRLLRLSKSRFTDVRPIREIAPWVPRFVAELVARSMELDPKARYQSPGEMLTDLRLIGKRLEDGQLEEPIDDFPPLVLGDRQAVVMLVESDTKRQDLLRDALRQTGYRVLVTDDPARAVMWFREQHEPADAVVLDASVLGDPALSAFNRLIAGPRTRHVPVILLLGPQQKKWQTKQKFAEHHVPLYFSTTTKPMLAALKRLVKAEQRVRPYSWIPIRPISSFMSSQTSFLAGGLRSR